MSPRRKTDAKSSPKPPAGEDVDQPDQEETTSESEEVDIDALGWD